MSTLRRPALTAEQLATVPAGVQPTVDGLMICLRCGRSFRQLGQHVVSKHRMGVEEYRRVYGLAAGLSLACAETRRVRSDWGRQQWERDPRLRERLRPNRTTVEERAEKARRARRDTAGRAGVAAAMRASGAAAGQAWLRSIDDRYAARAAALGFAGIAEMLDATQG